MLKYYIINYLAFIAVGLMVTSRRFARILVTNYFEHATKAGTEKCKISPIRLALIFTSTITKFFTRIDTDELKVNLKLKNLSDSVINYAYKEQILEAKTLVTEILFKGIIVKLLFVASLVGVMYAVSAKLIPVATGEVLFYIIVLVLLAKTFASYKIICSYLTDFNEKIFRLPNMLKEKSNKIEKAVEGSFVQGLFKKAKTYFHENIEDRLNKEYFGLLESHIKDAANTIGSYRASIIFYFIIAALDVHLRMVLNTMVH